MAVGISRGRTRVQGHQRPAGCAPCRQLCVPPPSVRRSASSLQEARESCLLNPGHDEGFALIPARKLCRGTPELAEACESGGRERELSARGRRNLASKAAVRQAVERPTLSGWTLTRLPAARLEMQPRGPQATPGIHVPRGPVAALNPRLRAPASRPVAKGRPSHTSHHALLTVYGRSHSKNTPQCALVAAARSFGPGAAPRARRLSRAARGVRKLRPCRAPCAFTQW